MVYSVGSFVGDFAPGLVMLDLLDVAPGCVADIVVDSVTVGTVDSDSVGMMDFVAAIGPHTAIDNV